MPVSQITFCGATEHIPAVPMDFSRRLVRDVNLLCLLGLQGLAISHCRELPCKFLNKVESPTDYAESYGRVW